MAADIKKIRFKATQNSRSYFDLVELAELLERQPLDHSQFEHHKLTFFVLMIITEGTGKHSINFQEFSYKKGTILAIRPDSIHKFHKSDAKGELLIFTEDFILKQGTSARIFQLFNEQLASQKQQLSPSDFLVLENHLSTIKREFREVQDDFSAEVIRSLLHVMITQLLRVKSLDNKALHDSKYLQIFLRFQRLVEAHYKEQKTIAYYADHLAITPRTLNNITHSIAHKSAKTVANDILMLHIKSYLINSDENVTQIAYKTGFQEASHLSKAFKKHTGMTPSEFRRTFG
jgi:AraC family transcriptional activator of pobA